MIAFYVFIVHVQIDKNSDFDWIDLLSNSCACALLKHFFVYVTWLVLILSKACQSVSCTNQIADTTCLAHIAFIKETT